METNRIALNGAWQVVPDEALAGKAGGWQDAAVLLAQPALREIQIPCCLETVLEDYEGVAWFHRAFSLAQLPQDCRATLCFGAVNYRAEVYVNGSPVGYHDGGYTDFTLDIADVVRAGGDNHLVVRVVTPLITKRQAIDGIGYNEVPHWRGAIAGGIWQDVELVVGGNVYLRRPFVKPDIHGQSAQVEATVVNQRLRPARALVSLTVWEEGADRLVYSGEQALTVQPGDNALAMTAPIPSPKLWSPDAPHLYRAALALSVEGEEQGGEQVRFGMREFTVKGKYFYLNWEKIILKAAFYEGLYPYTLAAPPSPAMVEEEIRLAKAAGLNLLRPWRKPQPPIVYELADRMGMMMIGAIAVECMNFWPQLSPFMEQRIGGDLWGMIERDRNHASIVSWEIFNEIHRPQLKRLRHKMALLARGLDDTRVIIDESGGFFDGASLYLPGERMPTTISDVHFYPGAPVTDGAYGALLALGKDEAQLRAAGIAQLTNTQSAVVPGVLTNITELGYGSSPDLERVMAQYAGHVNPLTPDYKIHKRLYDSYLAVLEQTGVLGDFGSLRDYCLAEQARHAAANKDMLEAARVNGDVGGIGIHAFVDGDWVVGAGMLDIHRNPKAAYYAMKQAFAPVFVAARARRRNVYAHEMPVLDCHAVNDGPMMAGDYRVTVEDDRGQSVFTWTQPVAVGLGAVQVAALQLPKLPAGRYAAHIRWMGADNRADFAVLDPVRRHRGTLHILDAGGNLANMLDRYGASWRAADDCSDTIYAAGPLSIAQGQWLAARVAAGATAVALDLPEGGAQVAGVRRIGQGVLPFALDTCESFGYWTPNNHIVRKGHPLFRGLPAGMMGEDYQNVCPRLSVLDQDPHWVLGMIGFGWYQEQPEKQNYTGVPAASHAADVFWRRHGKGRYLLSTMRLTGQLGRDPYADQIFFNLAAWLEEANLP